MLQWSSASSSSATNSGQLPFSTWDDTSTQKPCVDELCRLMIFAKKRTIAAPQKTGECIRIYATHEWWHAPTRKPYIAVTTPNAIIIWALNLSLTRHYAYGSWQKPIHHVEFVAQSLSLTELLQHVDPSHLHEQSPFHRQKELPVEAERQL